jgi:uncharacterized protein (TIGR02246 family)
MFRFMSAAFLAALICLGQSATAREPDDHGDDEAAIRRAAQEYMEAVREGDAERIAAFWTAEGDLIAADGQRHNGRRLARQAAEQPGDESDVLELKANVDSIRFITSNVAIEDGAAHISPTTDGAVVVRYTAVWVKRGGEWRLDGVRESAARPASHGEHLAGLAWMVGDWVEEGDSPAVELSCAWSRDKHFLIRKIRVHLADHGPLSVTQRIGWDAREKQIRSWTFDSRGGHGEGVWWREDERWLVEATSVLPDGALANGLNVYAPVDDDTFTWKSSEAELDGQPVPEHAVTMVRRSAGDQAERDGPDRFADSDGEEEDD